MLVSSSKLKFIKLYLERYNVKTFVVLSYISNKLSIIFKNFNKVKKINIYNSADTSLISKLGKENKIEATYSNFKRKKRENDKCILAEQCFF